MNWKKLTLALFLFFSVCFVCAQQTQEPVIVAVLDSPVDYSHPEIESVLAEDLLRNAHFHDQNGEEKSWYDLNQEAKVEFEKRLKNNYSEQVEYLKALASINHDLDLSVAQKKKLYFIIGRGTLKYALFPWYRSKLRIVGHLLHGTHVAGIAMKSLQQVKLISFPLITHSDKKIKLSEILNPKPEQYRLEVQKRFEEISNVLKQNKVRIVNLSVAASEEIALKTYQQKTNIFQKLLFSKRIETQALEAALMTFEGFQDFIRSNPETIFVIGAGNEGKNLTELKMHTGTLKAENLVTVTSVDAGSKLSSFSNFSESHIQIAAEGNAVKSALLGGDQIRMSGTSMATPQVTNVLAKLLQHHPKLSPQEAISLLYSKFTETTPALNDATKHGRFLFDMSDVADYILQISEGDLPSNPKKMSENYTDANEFQKMLDRHINKMQTGLRKMNAIDITVFKNNVATEIIKLRMNLDGSVAMEKQILNQIETHSVTAASCNSIFRAH